MTIQTKFNPDDKVYYLSPTGVATDTVLALEARIELDRSNPGTKPVIKQVVLYGLDENRSESFAEARLFGSVADLQKSLGLTPDKGE